MQAGKLRSLITILRATDGGQNAFGEPTVTWATLMECKAEEMPATGDERMTGQQTQAEGTVVFRIRRNAGVTLRRKDGIARGWSSPTEPTFDILDIRADPMPRPTSRQTQMLLICRELPD